MVHYAAIFRRVLYGPWLRNTETQIQCNFSSPFLFSFFFLLQSSLLSKFSYWEMLRIFAFAFINLKIVYVWTQEDWNKILIRIITSAHTKISLLSWLELWSFFVSIKRLFLYYLNYYILFLYYFSAAFIILVQRKRQYKIFHKYLHF